MKAEPSSDLNFPGLKIQKILNLQFKNYARYQNSTTTKIFTESISLNFFYRNKQPHKILSPGYW